MRTKSRGNGQGTAYRRGSSWTAEVVIGWRLPDVESKKPIAIKRTKGGFQTKRDALEYCPVLLNGGIAPATSAPRLSAYWDTYKSGEYKKLSQSKQTAYTIAWNRLKNLHDVPVDLLTIDLIRTTIASKCTTYYPARDCKSLLSNLYKLIGADGFASRDIPAYIVLPELNEKERLPFNDAEQKALWKLYESGDKRAAIPLVMIYTGMMPGEAMALKAENIDLESGTIVNSGLKTKVRKATPIVIADAIIPILEDLIAAEPSGHLWKRNKDNWYVDYYAALDAAKCRKLTPYSCRHTTATALAITENIAPQTIQRVMRWSTSRMLDRYAHPQTADARTAINSISK